MEYHMPPSAEEIRSWLKPLNESQVQVLATLASMPFPTLTKIRRGLTKNPGVDTVRKFIPFIAKALLS